MSSKALFRIALVQMKIGKDKQANISRALNHVKDAKEKGSRLVVLPECFNSPYGTKFFSDYAESIPSGETSLALSSAAKASQVYLVGGSIPERDGTKLYNTCTVWNPDGQLIAKFRKVHLFDIDIPNEIKFKESDVLSPGSGLVAFDMDSFKVGLGICYDVRFNEMATLYRKMGVDVLLYPGAFNMKTGPLHWELLLRARAVDNQMYVAGICGAQDPSADYIAWGHTMIIDPWGEVKTCAEFDESLLLHDIEKQPLSNTRQQIPTSHQRRTDIYDTVLKENITSQL